MWRTSAFRDAVMLLLLAGCASSFAQPIDDPVAGRALYDDTAGASGIASLTLSCANCHSVQSRRMRIAGDASDPAGAYADITFDTAMTRFVQATQNVQPMAPFGVLSEQQAHDIAAYIADTPKTSAAALDFEATAADAMTDSQSIDLKTAIATDESLTVDSVAITGAGSARFTRTSDSCDQQTLAPGASCRVAVAFSTPDAAPHDATLVFTLHQGASTTSFTRRVGLSGQVAASAPAPQPPAADSGGAGALGVGWLAALALAAGRLATSRRRATITSRRR